MTMQTQTLLVFGTRCSTNRERREGERKKLTYENQNTRNGYEKGRTYTPGRGYFGSGVLGKGLKGLGRYLKSYCFAILFSFVDRLDLFYFPYWGACCLVHLYSCTVCLIGMYTPPLAWTWPTYTMGGIVCVIFFRSWLGRQTFEPVGCMRDATGVLIAVVLFLPRDSPVGITLCALKIRMQNY